MVRRIMADVARGLAMGAADVVPGVSGGTVALLLGIYDRLVAQVAHLSTSASAALRGHVRLAFRMAAQAEWSFLAALAAGIAIAVVALVELVRYGIEEQPVGLSAAFFGLVLATAVITRREVSRWRWELVATAAAVAAAVFVLLGVRSGSVTDPAAAVIIAAGTLAVCAMILPGISGAFVLLMIGLYDPITAAVSQRDLATVSLFALGAAVGLGLFSRLLAFVLERRRDAVIAVLLGLMAGSLRVLWPWPVGDTAAEGFGNAALGAPPASEVPGALLAAAVAAALAVALRRFGGSQQQRVTELPRSNSRRRASATKRLP
ncbi:DUF368 domain-containing protein [Candidatus Poriferisodalis sp.]|uniref:DUF368 domain-containing protein n=1 Tax=Candidatus Poriferisodalis sp. TaxID=3101277 RepID=UPI003B01F214